MDGSFFCPGLAEVMGEHLPVMLHEAITGLGVGDAGEAAIFIDGTFGRGGHSAAILAGLKPGGRLHAFDQDPEAAAVAAQKFGGKEKFAFHAANFSSLKAVADRENLSGKVQGILLDLGVSSPQFDNAARGFSFSHDGPLDMRMNPGAGISAAAWLASAREVEIADVLFEFGDERNSRRIAKRIVETRLLTPITGTAQLAALIAAVPGPRSKNIHPATRSFQAIRIFINGELEALKAALAASVEVLAPCGRLAVISFHSLEDRIVKQFFREAGGVRREGKNKYAQHSRAVSETEGHSLVAARLTELGRYFPTEAECAANPRARSAVLRVAEKPAAA